MLVGAECAGLRRTEVVPRKARPFVLSDGRVFCWRGAAMARVDLPTTYDYRSVEQRLYSWWQEQGYFQPGPDDSAAPFVVSMPPPNVTGELHLGHAMFVAMEDLIIRPRSMCGRPALWVQGSV